MGVEPQTIGDRLRWCRDMAGMTGCELAALSGVSAQAISDLENGVGLSRTAEPALRAMTALRFTRVFGCSVEWLVLGGVRPDVVHVVDAVDRARAARRAKRAAPIRRGGKKKKRAA